MFLKSLTISKKNEIIREILFHSGINLIVDETPEILKPNQLGSGNDVGKTTTLKLIDFCLGANQKIIYTDPETNKENAFVKDFLKNEEVLITLVLKENLNVEGSEEIVIERNFLLYKRGVRKINGANFNSDEFENKLATLIFTRHKESKPTFRQIISHNIRYDDDAINNTLKTLDKYAKDTEYETLYLFLLGCGVENGEKKQEISARIKQENTFKNRLGKNQSKTDYETIVALLKSDVDKLNNRKKLLNINPDFQADLDELNRISYEITKVGREISTLDLRKNIILEVKQELESEESNIDARQLATIYKQATNQISGIQKTFEDLLKYHNQMIVEKIKFITQELPTLELNITNKTDQLNELKIKQEIFVAKTASKDTLTDLEKISSELGEKHSKIGEYSSIIKSLDEVEAEIKKSQKTLDEIGKDQFSEKFANTIKSQRDKFNIFFSSVSEELYGERYLLNYNIKEVKSQKIYAFDTFNDNFSSGKKQGEISCFDIAYILFAEKEKMECLHFLLNDKKELMDDNQLLTITKLVNKYDIQFVASILKNRLPKELNKEEYFCVTLSQEEKLFKIENYAPNKDLLKQKPSLLSK